MLQEQTIKREKGIEDYEEAPLDRWNKVTDLKYRMNTLLKFQLDILENATYFDFDSPIIVDGAIEGSGKSVLAQQIGYYLAWKSGNKLTLDQVVFTPKQFLQAIEIAPKRSCIVWDEAYAGNSKYRQSSTINLTIQNTLMKIRQKNLYIVIVLPYFFDLNSYLAVTRSWFLIHVDLKTQKDYLLEGEEIDFSKPIFIRGHFGFYSRTRKKALFFQGRREYNYDYVRANFIGMFPRFYTVDEEGYKAKKLEFATDEQEEKEKFTEKEWVMACYDRGMPVAKIQNFTSYTRRHLFNIKNEWEGKGTLTQMDMDD